MSEAAEGTQDAPTPSGLAGWLILVCLGLLLSPLRMIVLLVQVYAPIFQDGSWEAVTTPGADAYHALWAPILITELVGNTAFVAAGFVLLVLFFNKSRRFPRLFIAYQVANLLFILGDAWLGSLVLTREPMFDPDTLREFIRSLIGGLIWIPYMLVSRRVKNTFVG
jgi:hypothetical protein